MAVQLAAVSYVPLYLHQDRLIVAHDNYHGAPYWGSLKIDPADTSWKLITKDHLVINHGIWIGRQSGAAYREFLRSMGTLTEITANKS